LQVAPSGTTTNTGTFEASNGGTLHATGGTFASFSGGTLTGNYVVDGTGSTSTLQIDQLGTTGGEVLTIGDGTIKSGITLNGANANTRFVDANGNHALALGTVAANASLTLQNGYAMTTPGNLGNAGTVTIGGGGTPATLTVGPGGANTYTQIGVAALTQVDGNLKAATVTINSGLLDGNGTVTGNANNPGGTVKPGDPPGILTFTGGYGQGTGGALDIELGGLTGGTGSGHYSELLVDGSASLLGTLELNTFGGFNLANGESFDILGTGAGLTNDMAALDFNGQSCANQGGETYKYARSDRSSISSPS